MTKLWRSGIILTAVSFLAGLGNYAFQVIIGRHLAHDGEYGLANNTIGFTGFLGLPLAVATTAITHYIARFKFGGDHARLEGLLAGCRRSLFRLTVAGSVFAVLLVKPLSAFFNFPRTGLMLVALLCVLAGLWGSYVTALCQGLAWFKRLALIGLLGVGLRLAFCGVFVTRFPVAETAVLASVFMVLANLVLLFWRKDFTRFHGEPVSPWNREFVQYFIVSAACGVGGYFFLQGDQLVAQRYFAPTDRDAYAAAERLAVALPMTVGPLLVVLFTHRSGNHTGNAWREQAKLLGLYLLGLAGGAIALVVLRTFLLKLLGRNTPDAAGMIVPLAMTMVFVGLLQAFATWALASRWLKIALLYGGLGLAYWLTLLCLGKTPATLLHIMPFAAGISFGILFIIWLVTMCHHHAPVRS
jgi:O-antigen/teichoic acid export membrane protein